MVTIVCIATISVNSCFANIGSDSCTSLVTLLLFCLLFVVTYLQMVVNHNFQGVSHSTGGSTSRTNIHAHEESMTWRAESVWFNSEKHQYFLVCLGKNKMFLDSTELKEKLCRCSAYAHVSHATLIL